MKKDIHPKYLTCQVTCTCGHTFEILSNQPTLRIEVCDKCHPFYTGQERNLDRGGKVEKFKKKYGLK
ncbi:MULTISPECIES: 50S ribosomal protein L31 [unclassified Lebetimonas]|uniref:50S ribosomal protein L31 n=1 Tax=unclassified Lebetimonas TaxID=2648158 RepID=UPI0004641DAD|nr:MULTISPECIES: 50S ribosomal protein L31 [unclassified Lebetimonas]